MNLDELTREEIALLLNCSTRTISEWTKLKPPIPQFRNSTGKNFAYKWTDCLKWFLDKEKKPLLEKVSQPSEDSIEELRKQKTAKEVEILQIEIDEKLKKLLPADEIEKTWVQLINIAKTNFLEIPFKLSQSLFDGMTALEKEEMIAKEIKRVLNDLANQTIEDDEDE